MQKLTITQSDVKARVDNYLYESQKNTVLIRRENAAQFYYLERPVSFCHNCNKPIHFFAVSEV